MSFNEDLEKFYPGCKVYGPYKTSNGRSKVIIKELSDEGKVARSGKIRSITYARSLMILKEKRILATEEEVDHVDENKSNDDISNLQILTEAENIRKNTLFKQGFIRKDLAQLCKECGEEVFSSKKIIFCGGSCRSKALVRQKKEEGRPLTPPTNYHTVDDTTLEEMIRKRNSGQSIRSIARDIGFNRATVQKYLNNH